MDIINQYSYVFMSLFVVVALFFGARRLKLNWVASSGVSVLAAALLLAGFLALRPGASDVDSAEAARALINSGKPTLIEFYSNYCAGCISARPLVDAVVGDIEARYGEAFNVLRIDIHTDFGRALREQYGFSFTPEFVLFNSAGVEIWRSHIPPTGEQVDNAAASLNDVAESNPAQS